MTERMLTHKQLERELSQKIRALYNVKLDFVPRKVTCKLFSRYLAIVVEEAMTPLEQSLLAGGKTDLILQVQKEISQIFRSSLSEIVEEIVGVKVVAVLTNTTLTGNKCGTLVILSESPKVRLYKASPKLGIEKSSEDRC